METRILGNVSIHGSVRLAQNEAGFPVNPQIGTIIVKDQCIYAYIKIGGLETWYPFASKTNSYVHVQGLPALVWNINHALGTTDIWSQVKDDSGNIVQALVHAVDADNATITFTTPITGTAVIVAPDTIDVPEVKATAINVANSAVIIDSSGVRVDGSYVLTAANIEAYAAAAVQAEADARTAADTTLQNNINAEATARANADTAIQSTISNNIDQSVKTTATPQFAGLKLTGHVLPNTDIAFDLGSVNKRFRDLYLSGSTIHLGDGKISYNATTNTFDLLNPQSTPAKTSLGANTTDDLAEGTTHLYYTAARAQALIDVEASARQSADNALQTLIDEKQNILGFTPENIANRGVANGYASLGSDGKVPTAQLPSYVDDVVEYANLSGFPTTGETAKIYVALDTNKTYRWSGTAYIQITSGAVDSVAGKTGVVTLTKADVGLSAVDNTADSVKSVLSASRLTTARSIGGTSFDGQSNIDISYTNLIDKPTLGTAASKDTPTSGNAVASQVVLGNDTRLSDARTPTAHNQSWSTITNTPTTAAGYGITDVAPSSHVGSGGTAHSVATTLVNGFMSTSDKTKLNGIADNANNYIHPTTDGNLHVPATGTTNNGNVLVAGSSPGSFSWQALTKTTFGLGNVDNTSDVNKPISTATQAAFQAEADARTAADTTLQNNINAEATARANADTALQNTINTNIDQSVKTSATPQFAGVKLTGHIVPVTDFTYDLGTATKRFRDLYLSGSTIHLGDGKISYNSTSNEFDLLNPQSQPAKVSLSANTTDDLAEGTTHLYYTAARAQALVDVEASARQSADAALQTLIGTKEDALGFTPENSANRGVANGYATLGADGKVPTAQLPSYVDDVLEYTSLTGFPLTGETSKIYVALDTNKIYRWSGTTYIEISPTAGNTDSANKLSSQRTISASGDAVWSVTFDGSSDVTANLTLSNSGITAGTYNNSATAVTPLTIDAKGRVTSAGSAVTITPAWSSITGKPTTLSGYGITDAATINSPEFTGTPTAPTASAGTNTTQIATTAFVTTAVTAATTSGITSYANGEISSATLTTSTITSGQVVDQNAATTYRSVKYTVQVKSGTSYQLSELLVLHDGTNAYITEFGNIQTGSALAVFDADIFGGNLRLLVTPVNAATVIKVIKTLIDI